ncbi:hypothetical protein BUQ71_05660 [Escherichia coli]|nr:hypothetical protein BUQ71_05660 [Escherichia coli]EFO1775648.1 hypothetical protein [Escherichia coli]
MKRGQSLPFLAQFGDDLDQSPRPAFINCIINQNYRNLMQNHFCLSCAIFFYLLMDFRQKQ